MPKDESLVELPQSWKNDPFLNKSERITIRIYDLMKNKKFKEATEFFNDSILKAMTDLEKERYLVGSAFVSSGSHIVNFPNVSISPTKTVVVGGGAGGAGGGGVSGGGVSGSAGSVNTSSNMSRKLPSMTHKLLASMIKDVFRNEKK